MQCNVTVDFGFKFHGVSGLSLAVGVEIRYGHLIMKKTKFKLKFQKSADSAKNSIVWTFRMHLSRQRYVRWY